MKNNSRGFIIPLIIIVLGILAVGGAAVYYKQKVNTPQQPQVQNSIESTTSNSNASDSSQINNAVPVSASNTTGTVNSISNSKTSVNTQVITKVTSKNQKILSEADFEAMAGTKYSDGNIPLGDYKYITTGPKKGYIYLCNARKDNPGSMVLGPWVHGTTWNLNEKVSVTGSVSWPQAHFSNTTSATTRTLSGNGLPVGYATGIFPVQSSDPAYAYDRNPNTISAQSLSDTYPLSPTYSDTPNCMGGEVGIMLDGVPIFNGFDAGLRDAPAHELQDSCDGHPQGSGEYHYHSLSACFGKPKVSQVLGYALDGFPITGPYVTDSTYLTTDNLDECHGITSEVSMDGKKVVIYHYVMTKDFPYSASCFRGKPVRIGPSSQLQQNQNQQNQTGSGMQTGFPSGQPSPSPYQSPSANGMPTPPQQAISACSGLNSGSSCSFTSPYGDTVSGSCQNTPDGSFACVPGR